MCNSEAYAFDNRIRLLIKLYLFQHHRFYFAAQSKMVLNSIEQLHLQKDGMYAFLTIDLNTFNLFVRHANI